MGTLTTAEKRKLKQHEETIERGQRAFMDVGRALIAIREENLYLEVADTFEAYVKKRWNRTRQWAYQQIEAMEIADDLNGLEVEIPGENGDSMSTIVDIDNEGQARELAKLDCMQDRADAISKAAKTAKIRDGKPVITAAAIRKAAAESNGPPKKNPSPKKPAPKKPAEEVTGQQWCKYQVEQVKAQIKGMDEWRKKHQVDNENWAKVDEHLSCLFDAFKALGRFKS